MTLATTARRLPEQLAAEQFSRLRQRLRRITGQILGIERILEADADCGDVLVQLAAAQCARRGAGGQVFTQRGAVTAAAVGAVITDPGGAVADLTRLVGLLTGAAVLTRVAGRDPTDSSAPRGQPEFGYRHDQAGTVESRR